MLLLLRSSHELGLQFFFWIRGCCTRSGNLDGLALLKSAAPTEDLLAAIIGVIDKYINSLTTYVLLRFEPRKLKRARQCRMPAFKCAVHFVSCAPRPGRHAPKVLSRPTLMIHLRHLCEATAANEVFIFNAHAVWTEEAPAVAHGTYIGPNFAKLVGSFHPWHQKSSQWVTSALCRVERCSALQSQFWASSCCT